MQALNKNTKEFTAAKICELKGEDDLDDFTVEIDILTECRHPNIVGLTEAFFFESKLWVYCLNLFLMYIYSFLRKIYNCNIAIVNKLCYLTMTNVLFIVMYIKLA